MKIFEPHIHMFSRITDDYENLRQAGVRAVLEPAFWLGQNRTSVGSFIDYFDTLVGWERFRSQQFGIHHFCTMALNPREANDDRVNDAVMEILPRYLGVSIYRLDANVRHSTVVGIVGAGGIGQTLSASFSRYDYDFSLAILLTIVALVFAGEFFSNWVRGRLR